MLETIIEDLAGLANRPYDFVIWAFPWGEPGTDLHNRKGPVPWQKKVLLDLQEEMTSGRGNESTALADAYQAAIKSGHDVGKSALLSWLIWWALSTRVDTRGRATANTEKQLSRILWAEVSKWHRLFIARDLFKVTATAVFSADPEHEKNWRIDAIPWSEDNPEAFAGLHNYGKRIILLFDEASAIFDKIWEVVDGVTHEADTEILWFATGNPTRNYGRFRDCFGRFASEWRGYTVDSRDVPFANVGKIERAIALYGIDSDYVKVRYLGEFPSASTSQLIPLDTIEYARTREVQSYHYEPLIMGVDVARFGANESVIQFRRGKDARTIPAIRKRGYSTVELGNLVAALLLEHEVDGCFIDEGGVGGGVIDFVRHLGHSCIGVNFGVPATTRPNGVLVGNKRAEMYVMLRDALREGLCIENSIDLQQQLVVIEYFFNKKQEIMLVSKEDMADDGIESPDWADALCLTYAYPVATKSWRRSARRFAKQDYDPFSNAAVRGEEEPSDLPERIY